ncbi:FAD/NAD(P)-binding domain-containing protein [Coniochaeta ligniaria NRRL 30616]|uniref:FAD/NAD(P)-binding domain-containing protein n=1 Tax=Coniochaeta ligniaria NRRL 30616 TaxID=1408157 RepID=A0A1J7JBE9_9PEZI|nr:FAD/NAD(P)-binding domain-containing protein [Coniochaeta ligniaria NRRL 30616]
MRNRTRAPFSIAIIGGGITGLTLAIALHRRNVDCTVYEQAPSFKEIGAGLGFHPGAVQALRLCDEDIFRAFEKVCTVNKWDSKRHVWFDVFDGTADVPANELEPAFTIVQPQTGGGSCHRARFLDKLVKLLPKDRDIARFDKRLERIEDDEGGCLITFCDGTVARADAVIGCDGIKSRTRELMLGDDKLTQAKCGYSGKYAYRCLIPMAEAIEALGEEKAANTSLWMGPNCHALTFPVSHGNTLNLVAFVSDNKRWPDEARLTLPATREEILHDFREFGPNVSRLIAMIDEKPDRWGLFDLAEHPLPGYFRGRICLAGDAAHASTPHHGAGAGVSIEDVAVLSTLLADESLRGPEDLEAVFAAYDESRRARTQWLVQSSRRAADLYEWRDAKIGKDYDGILGEINARQAYIWNLDLRAELDSAREGLKRRLASRSGS